MDERAVTTLSRISEGLKYVGYVLSEDVLRRADTIARTSVRGRSNAEDVLFSCSLIEKKNERRLFESIEAMLGQIEEHRLAPLQIELQYLRQHKAGISLTFKRTGWIELSAFSDEIDFEFNIDKLKRELSSCEQEYAWPVRSFIFKNHLAAILSAIFMSALLFIFLNVLYYIYGRSVGVDINPELIPAGNSYAQLVESALESATLEEKVDLLLRGQLRGFRNISEILNRTQRWISYGVSTLSVSLLFILALRSIRKIYPRAFLALGPNQQRLEAFKRRREVWAVSILIAFIVNLVAGLVVAYLA